MGGLLTDMPTLRRATKASRDPVPDPDASSDASPEDAPSGGSAVAAWFDDALPRIFGYFLPRVGGDIHVAEDLTQETMLAAVRTRGDGSAVGAVMPWLFGIARHKLIDHYREAAKHRQHRTGNGDELDDLPEDDRTLPALDLHSIHVRDTIIATLLHLPPRQRLAIVLRYFDDQPVTMVAGALDLTLAATESLLARSRRSFRTHYLANTGDGDES
jgi:RNA polymerase sigma-70 factor (ECF subfamily)